ncbi:MAG: hypothetical protein ISR70_03240 [Candidatus Thioglobus sp.]|nr:hypothetical protein [Candidatus Thioglobus pontius]MBL6977058.1 hypothetical protein [Candidatus Thioglobus sp.]
MSNYQRISCEDHSIYELVIMRGQSMNVEIDGEVVSIKPIDVTTKEGSEFLVYLDDQAHQQTIRADLVTIQK